MKDNMKKVLAGLMVALMLLSGSAMFALAEESGTAAPTATAEGQPQQTEGGEADATAAGNTGEETPAPTTQPEPTTAPKVMHIVTLFDADGFLFMSRPIEDGKFMPKPQDGPAPEGYRFLYWYNVYDPDMSEFLFEETPVNENLELWAFVELIPVEEEPAPPAPEIADPTQDVAPDNTDVDNTGDTDNTPDDTNNTDNTDNTDNTVVVDGDTGKGILIIGNDKVDEMIDGPKDTDEGDADDTQDETEEPKVERKVIIRSNVGAVVLEGDTITLMAELVGFDGLEYTLQWQSNDGTGWVDVEGATEINYTYTVSADNVDFGWRLLVKVAEEEG